MSDIPEFTSLTARIAASVPDRGIRLAYGDVQSIDGASLLPVAIVTYGFGGSDGSAQWGVGDGAGALKLWSRSPSAREITP